MTKEEKLHTLKEEILKTVDLPIKKSATQLVFGVGSPDADLFFLGEAPGYNEDQQGEPFVGNAGKLLDKAINYLGLDRQKVFITNVVMYRPPSNRDPFPTELAAFSSYIDQILEIIQPKIIVTLGRFSMAKFLPDVKITQVHGKQFKKQIAGQEVTIIPMFHPAAALRNPEFMKLFKLDFVPLKKLLEKNV